MARERVLVHLASGIGNIVLATPLLIALSEMDFEIDVLLHADYDETGALLQGWQIIRRVFNGHKSSFANPNAYKHILPAIPPFYWNRFGRVFGFRNNLLPKPDEALFYQNEQEYYLSLARRLGYPVERRPFYHLPIAPAANIELPPNAVVMAPGCKTGEMAKKRWPYFPQLAARFENVVIVGTADDMYDCHDRPLSFASSARSLVGKLTLKETAEVMALATVVVGNDSGLAHLAAALGVPTIMIFGPTPHLSLGQMPPHVTILRAGLACEPCWLRARFRECAGEMHCLQQVTVEQVESEIRREQLSQNS